MATSLREKCGPENEDFFSEFSDLPMDPPEMRSICNECGRPAVVCWCSYVPRPPVDVLTTVLILQHPYEEKRTLKTAPMLKSGLAPGKCCILKGKRFNLARNELLKKIVESPKTLLLFPGPEAVDISEIVAQSVEENGNSTESKVTSGGEKGYAKSLDNVEGFNLILLDGTWAQAKGLYMANHFLHNLKQVQFTNPGLSEYVIRTQPADGALSTLETAAMALALLEQKPHIREPLLEPLRALCKFQMDHGAVMHHSKEFLIENGLYPKQQPKDPTKKSKIRGQCIRKSTKINKVNCDKIGATSDLKGNGVVKAKNIDGKTEKMQKQDDMQNS